MNKSTAYFYRLTCVTNLHVGSGEANYNVVDNEVERDPIQKYPIIHSSGVKGALREHFRKAWSSEEGVRNIVELFGSEPGKSSKDQTSPGCFKFLNAIMAARPVRVSQGPRSSILATTTEQLEDILSLAEALSVGSLDGVSVDLDVSSVAAAGKTVLAAEGYTGVEGFRVDACNHEAFQKVSQLLGNKDIAVVGKDAMEEIALPVVAHNYLENGISRNLWYEEFVPRGSVFYLGIVVPSDKSELFEAFDKELAKELIQIGANASLGYGLCRFERIG